MKTTSSADNNVSATQAVCHFCDKPTPENAIFCPQCGARMDAYLESNGNSGEGNETSAPFTQDNGASTQVVSDSAKAAPDSAEIAEVAKSVERLAHPLGFVDFLDVFNPMGCLVFSTIGIIVFLLNPVRLLVSFGYHCSADARLKEGNIKKAKELVSQCHKVNAALFGIFAIVWLVVLKAYDVI
jgi:hypothetical protein